jgi:hypothetical protein
VNLGVGILCVFHKRVNFCVTNERVRLNSHYMWRDLVTSTCDAVSGIKVL